MTAPNLDCATELASVLVNLRGGLEMLGAINYGESQVMAEAIALLRQIPELKEKIDDLQFRNSRRDDADREAGVRFRSHMDVQDQLQQRNEALERQLEAARSEHDEVEKEFDDYRNKP